MTSLALPAPRRSALAARLSLLLLLPMFLQSFHYVVDVPALYMLSKAWPLLTMPLALLGLMQRLPYAVPLMALLAYTATVTPVMTLLYFGQDYPSALTGVLKILPFTYYFSLGWLLHRLRPEPEDLEWAFTLLGALTLLLLALLWIVVPAGAYWDGSTGAEVSKLFLREAERGYRITLPMVFGIIFIFLQARAALRRGPLLRLLLPLGAVALLVIAFKQRVVIGGILALLIFILAAEGGLRRRLLLAGGLALAGVAVLLLAAGVLPLELDQLGGSLTARQFTTTLALDFLAQNPLRWIFGAGALTRASSISFQEWFAAPNFYLVDIGWLGVVFEYGLVGGGMILAVYLGTLLLGQRTPSAPNGALTPALRDYACFLLLTSPILSVVWAPGEVCSLLAIFVYLRSRLGQAPDRGGTRIYRSGEGWR
ncbi:MAG TPA: hypothetical protein VNR89_10900 [Roseomonas sp.]|nr:hypothetical protein [Roseomonas sp.]